MLSKNKTLILFCLIISSINYVYCQDLIPFKVNDKWGYADASGKLVFNAVYDSVGVFEWNSTLKKYGSMVYKGDKSMYINKKNKSIFSTDYKDVILYNDWILARDAIEKLRIYLPESATFSDFTFDTFQVETNFLIVERNKKIGIIDSEANIIIPIEYNQIFYHVFYDCEIDQEEYEKHQLKDFTFEQEDKIFYINGEAISKNKDMILATLINDKETKRVIELVKQKKSSNSNDDYEEVIELYDADNENMALNEISKKVGLDFTECDKTNEACIFKKEGKYGVYNLKTKQSSELFDKVELLEPFGVFKVKNENGYGLYDKSTKQLMPVIYSQFIPDYKSDYIVTATTYIDAKSTYYYYNLKTKKYIIGDCDFLYRSYVEKSSKNGVYYFAVKKDDAIFYVNENGVKYIK